MQEGGKVLEIAKFLADRRRRGQEPGAEPEEVVLELRDLGFLLADIGITRTPLGEMMVTGPGAMLDRGRRLLPLFTARQARLIGEVLIASARAAECEACSAGVAKGTIDDPPPPCARCGGDV